MDACSQLMSLCAVRLFVGRMRWFVNNATLWQSRRRRNNKVVRLQAADWHRKLFGHLMKTAAFVKFDCITKWCKPAVSKYC
jgi:hypothetical protein